MPKSENKINTSAITSETIMYSALQQPPPLCGDGNLADNYRYWKRTFDWYLIASGRENTSDREKCALFLHVIGPVGRDIYEELDVATEEELSYTSLCDKFSKRCDPQKNVNFERHVFFETVQNKESFEKFLALLKIRSKTCEFDKLRESLILTQLIRGVRDVQLRERMLRKSDLKLEEAASWCRAAEIAGQQANTLQSTASGTNVSPVTNNSLVPVEIERVNASLRNRVPSTEPRRVQRARWSGNVSRGPRGTYHVDSRNCKYCNFNHERNKCPAYNVKCFRCYKMGHFAKCCKAVLEIELSSDSDNTEIVNFIEINSISKGWFQKININNVDIRFKLDSGADVCVMSKSSFQEAGFNLSTLHHSGNILREVSRNILPVLGHFKGKLCHKNKTFITKIYVVDLNCNNLLSRDACIALNLIIRVDEVVDNHQCDLFKKYKCVFEGIGRLPGTHTLLIDESVPPVVSSSRKIPIKLRPKLQEELHRLEKLNIIKRVDEPTDWVSSIVLVEKPDGKLRLCIDPQYLNKAIKRSHFQLPTLEEITSSLSGAKFFSHLDASKAFLMVVLDERSSKLCTFATPFGRFRFLRMPFGLCSASEVFHNAMYKIFCMDGVELFIDDLLIFGKTKEEHDKRLDAVLRRAAENGVRFNKDKCILRTTEIKYLGHIFDKNGMRPDPDRVSAIKNMPIPNTRKELERFLGMTNYLSRFIPNYANRTEPFRCLLKKNSEFLWHEGYNKNVNALKNSIIKAPTLRFYNPNEPVILSVDASLHGLGACLLQSDRPIAFAARTLTSAETRWAQIEKEMLAIVFGCMKFHQYIYGHECVTVESDHKPLESIFKKPLNETPVRLQRMLLRLQKYNLNIKYIPGRFMYIADTLSRSPAGEECNDDTHSKVEIHVNTLYDNVNLEKDKLKLIKEQTALDKALCGVIKYCQEGWPHTKHILKSETKPFWAVKEELHIINGIIFRGDRVVIPKNLWQEMLRRVHEGHLGIEKCKRRARDVMWWPGMTTQIEHVVKACDTCSEHLPSQPREPLIPHELPGRPWENIASDIFQIRSKYYLLVVDYYSKYVEVYTLPDIRSSTVIDKLKATFARYGIPKKLITDNGLQFMSEEFKQFAKHWEFQHTTSSPYYARSNGFAERNVQTVKRLLEKAKHDKTDPYLALLNFRNTPISGEEYSPAQLLMGRRLNTRLPVYNKLLKPKNPSTRNIENRRISKINKSKQKYDMHTKELRPLHPDEQVRIREQPGNTGRWIRARVVNSAPQPRSYWVRTANGSSYRRNRQQIRAENQPTLITPRLITNSDYERQGCLANFDDDDYKNNADIAPDIVSQDNAQTTQPSNSIPSQVYYRTRSGRQVRPPDRYK